MQAAELISRPKFPTISELYAIIDGKRYELCIMPDAYAVLDEDFFDSAKIVKTNTIYSFIPKPKRYERIVRRGNDIFDDYVECTIRTRDGAKKNPSTMKSKSGRNFLAAYEYNLELLRIASGIVFVHTEEWHHRESRLD